MQPYQIEITVYDLQSLIMSDTEYQNKSTDGMDIGTFRFCIYFVLTFS